MFVSGMTYCWICARLRRRLSTELEGDIDLQGLLALDDDVPVGYQQIRLKMDVDADCSDEELADLIEFAKAHSPVCNTLTNAVPVEVTCD